MGLQIVLKVIYTRTELNSYPKVSINHVLTQTWLANFLLVTILELSSMFSLSALLSA